VSLRESAVDPDFASAVEHPSFRSFVEHLPCVLYVGEPTWPPTIVFISANVERFLGYKPEDFCADPTLSLRCIHPEDRARFVERVRGAMTRAEPYHVEYRAVHRNGRDVYHAATLSVPVLDAEGRVVRRHGIIVDRTEQKRLEGELLQAQRLAAVGELATMMAHEIRNPLAGMSLALRALRGLAGDGPEARECLDDLESCIVQINDTVSRALDYAGQRPLAVGPCRLEQIVASACKFTATYMRRHRVQLHSHVPPDLPRLVADAGQLEQVFVNLIITACKAMPEGGRLTMRAWADPPLLLAEVSDTGVGVVAGELGPTPGPLGTGIGDGAGLALSLCQRILTAHGGTISVRSSPGGGTTFRLGVPLEQGDASRAAR